MPSQLKDDVRQTADAAVPQVAIGARPITNGTQRGSSMCRRIILISSLLALLAACTWPGVQPQRPDLHKPPSEAAFVRGDFGAPPSDDAQKQVRDALRSTLDDPDSASYSFAAPVKGWIPLYYVSERRDPDGGIHVGQVYGWTIGVTLDTKTHNGDSSGPIAYSAFIKDAQLKCVLWPSLDKDAFGYDTAVVVWRRDRSSSSVTSLGSSSAGAPKTVQVRGYYRKDGTYVRPHTRSAPRRH